MPLLVRSLVLLILRGYRDHCSFDRYARSLAVLCGILAKDRVFSPTGSMELFVLYAHLVLASYYWLGGMSLILARGFYSC